MRPYFTASESENKVIVHTIDGPHQTKFFRRFDGKRFRFLTGVKSGNSIDPQIAMSHKMGYKYNRTIDFHGMTLLFGRKR